MSSFSKSSEAAPPGAALAWTGWTTTAYLYAALVAAGFAYFLFALPVQLTDSFGNMQQLRHGTLGELVYNQLYQAGYLRPLLWGQLRVVFDLSGGNYTPWFRAWHVGQVAILIALFMRLLRPRTAADVAAVAVGLAALLGIHTFAGAVREAFPINTFMTILLCCFAAADLALGAPRWWRTPLAWLLFVFAAMTVESGLLVAVVFVMAFVAGARGVSRAGVIGVVALTVGYFWLRFVVLDVGAPALIERSSGFGFGSLEPDELNARFGGNPYPFYLYNVLSSLGSVLFAEPRGGVFGLTRGFVEGDVLVADVINLIASTLGTVLIAGYLWSRRRAWLTRQLDRKDQLVAVFWGLLAANAVISYPYTKDVIMSPAGAFFAVALAVAVTQLLDAQPSPVPRPGSGWAPRPPGQAPRLRSGQAPRLRSGQAAAPVAVTALLLVTSSLWAWRMVGTHVGLREAAGTERNEWAYADQWFNREQNAPTTPEDIRMKEQLQGDAVARWRPILSAEWLEWFPR